ncbi:hypothetical protein LIER_31857 [Lithospermum erythrorhizon]|uniref:Uncharacterized protein n=1 Tax=Lithospermum erythrorhizon TaxID=34254 RepID=A0AAV3RSY4_LITER
MVLSWIQATVSVDILWSLLQHGHSLTTREAWLKISALFISQAQSQEVQLKREFFNFTKGDHLSMLDYITQMKSLADSLLAIEAIIIEKDLVAQLCIRLPEDYISIITSITTRVPSPLIWKLAHCFLTLKPNVNHFPRLLISLLLASKHSSGSSSVHRGRGATPSGSSPASLQSFVPFDDQLHFDTGATSHMTSNSGTPSFLMIMIVTLYLMDKATNQTLINCASPSPLYSLPSSSVSSSSTESHVLALTANVVSSSQL